MHPPVPTSNPNIIDRLGVTVNGISIPQGTRVDKAVFEPFMVGPRSCIGKNLAIAEMRLILAKVLWQFDLVLSEKNQGDWSDQKSYLSNAKKPLFVRLRQRVPLRSHQSVGKVLHS